MGSYYIADSVVRNKKMRQWCYHHSTLGTLTARVLMVHVLNIA